MDPIVEARRSLEIDLHVGGRVVQALLGVDPIGLIVLVEPVDPREFEVTDVIRMVDDAHRIGFEKSHPVSVPRHHRPTRPGTLGLRHR